MEQGVHSRIITSDNIETYVMLHNVFAYVGLTSGEVRGQRNSIELRNPLLPREDE